MKTRKFGVIIGALFLYSLVSPAVRAIPRNPQIPEPQLK